jgi:hypothetical protein
MSFHIKDFLSGYILLLTTCDAMQTSFVTFRFLHINNLHMHGPPFPVHEDGDYIEEHVKGTLDAPILDICKIKCDEMTWSFNDCLFVFRNGVPVQDDQTPKSMYIPSGDYVNIYVMYMEPVMKEVYMNTMFDSMMQEMHKKWDIMHISDEQRMEYLEVTLNSEAKRHYACWTSRECKYNPPSSFSKFGIFVARQEGVRRAAEEFMRQAW